jgi:hypothetical protein
MNGIPRFEASSDGKGRCRPYLQIFKAAKLLYTSTGRNADSALRYFSYPTILDHLTHLYLVIEPIHDTIK